MKIETIEAPKDIAITLTNEEARDLKHWLDTTLSSGDVEIIRLPARVRTLADNLRIDINGTLEGIDVPRKS